ncbi:tRNA adenosine deaminase-associated protein [Corynebacterium suicordis]|nr:tRNA adenosine deaminase-associated protein [Corynebacterium suicordis]MDR6278398.1 putative tRNA adenosine deaminase-associated protein [Corynebacterium suicordis]
MSMSENWEQPTFAAAAHNGPDGWNVRVLPERTLLSLDDLLSNLRESREEGAVLGLVCVEDDWVAIVRPVPSGMRVLLSDATAALDFDLASDLLDELDVDAPEEADADSDEPWPEGDFGLLEDLGAGEQVLSVIFDDDDLYGAAQLFRVADEVGFAEELADATGLDLDEYLLADGDF